MTATPTPGLPDILTRKLRSAKRTLWMERIARAFWPLWCVVLVALALLVLQVFGSMPGIWGAVLAGVVGLAVLLTLVLGVRSLKAPTRADAMRRLDDSLGSRAVTMLDEDIAVGQGDADAEALWRAHRERVAQEASAAKAPDADLRLAPFDGWNLRFAAVGVFLAALGYAQVGGVDRIAALLDPTPPAAKAATLAPALEAWAAPPPYTGAAPIYLTERSGETITVPTGSVLTLRASGIEAMPMLTGMEAEFTEEAPGIYGLTRDLTTDSELAVLFGETPMADWRFAVTPDLPPTAEIADAPEPSAERGLAFSYLGQDDYGVVAARTSVIADRSGMADAPEEIDPPIDLELGVFTGYADAPEPVAFEEDFTEHPLAGSPVQMVIEVEDAAGQTGESELVQFILPARVFTEPMAKALIEQRRALAWDIRDSWDVLDLLEAVTDYPDDYFTDTKAALMTTSAIKRLTYALEQDRVLDERADILDLLWQAALRLEEGDLSDELEQLRAAQRRLQDALERGASDEEIERLMDEMRQAMRNYLDEMVRQAQRDQQNGQQQQGQQQQQQTLSREDLERMLDQMEQSAKDGAREQAEQMLSQLGQMLENLQMGQGQSGQGGEQQQQEQALQEMMRRQQDLADETFRELQDGQNQQGQDGQQGEQQGQQQQPGGQEPGQQQGQGPQGQQGQGQSGEGSQRGQGQRGQGGTREGGQGRGEEFGQEGQGGRQQPGQRPGQRGNGLSRQQEGLRGDLDSMIPGVPDSGDARGALDQAERDMEAARDRLSEGDLDSALDEQARALDRLREGAQALAEEGRREAQESGQGQENGQGSNADTGQNPDQLDPFGRVGRTFGPDDGQGVEVPGERARNRAQEIQREIRRRQGERERPTDERDYLDRLQDRF